MRFTKDGEEKQKRFDSELVRIAQQNSAELQRLSDTIAQIEQRNRQLIAKNMELEERFKKRPSRPEDLDHIRQLQLQLDDSAAAILRLQEEAKFFKLELLNREDVYNHMFAAGGAGGGAGRAGLQARVAAAAASTAAAAAASGAARRRLQPSPPSKLTPLSPRLKAKLAAAVPAAAHPLAPVGPPPPSLPPAPRAGVAPVTYGSAPSSTSSSPPAASPRRTSRPHSAHGGSGSGSSERPVSGSRRPAH
eukprot:TRINITY_DN4332_c0_g1_i2.p1 TRINITY_DN4332_c0_g1~~TRINITY_DN4332_c0_g1_i2.p1  ORF type:complete len:248 (+),score=69.64 TRINITY_DN4332_c0_g1_i2:488-1231(+)